MGQNPSLPGGGVHEKSFGKSLRLGSLHRDHLIAANLQLRSMRSCRADAKQREQRDRGLVHESLPGRVPSRAVALGLLRGLSIRFPR